MPLMKLSFASLLVIFLLAVDVAAQAGGHILFGDIKVDERETNGSKVATFQVLLYSESGSLLMRQTVPSNGRYRFLDLRNGRYEVVVEVENSEIARVLVSLNSPFKTDFRQDIEFQWREGFSSRAGVISVADNYTRSAANATLFRKANKASAKKRYDEAILILREIVVTDSADFQ